MNATLVKIFGTSISSRTTVTKVNEMKLDRGLSFIGFLWRVRRAVWPWDSLSILASIWFCLLCGWEYGVGLLVFSHADVSAHPIPLLKSSHCIFHNPSLLSSHGFGSPGWLFAWTVEGILNAFYTNPNILLFLIERWTFLE